MFMIIHDYDYDLYIGLRLRLYFCGLCVLGLLLVI